MDIPLLLKNMYGVDDELALLLVNKGVIKNVKKGNFIYYQDEWADSISIPLTGIFSFTPTCEDGGCIQYNLISPGIIINEPQLILGGEFQNDVKAVTDAVIIQLPFSIAEVLMKESLGFVNMITMSLAKKQRATLGLFNLRGEKDITHKVMRALQIISSITADGLVPVNIITLASLLCISRNTVGREIKRFIEDGEIIKDGSGYRLVEEQRQAAA